MNNANYAFFEEFKRLDKLCGELYNDRFGITHYIDDMKSAPVSNYKDIPKWKMDLDELIRLRHIRNYLAHTENAFDENICEQKDIDWIKNFYQRILNQSDPIALLYKNSRRKSKPIQKIEKQVIEEVTESNEDSFFLEAGIIFVIIIFVIIILIF